MKIIVIRQSVFLGLQCHIWWLNSKRCRSREGPSRGGWKHKRGPWSWHYLHWQCNKHVLSGPVPGMCGCSSGSDHLCFSSRTHWRQPWTCFRFVRLWSRPFWGTVGRWNYFRPGCWPAVRFHWHIRRQRIPESQCGRPPFSSWCPSWSEQ